MPEGWVQSRADGSPITDPRRINEGTYLPMAGHKGSGLSLVIGLLAGPLNGAAFGRDVRDFAAPPSGELNVGQFVVALDVARFLSPELFKAEVDRHIRDLNASRRLPGVDAIRVPGQGRARAATSASQRHPAQCRAGGAGRRGREVARHRPARRPLVSATMSEPQSSSPFWRFSLRFYRRPEVADACIALQDEAGVDVNLLLFLLWQATSARELSPAEVAVLDERVGAWRNMTVIPLRGMRARAKSRRLRWWRRRSEPFRTRIKAAELEAERLQQEAMYELACATPLGREAPSAGQAARANVAAYERVAGARFQSRNRNPARGACRSRAQVEER